MVILFCKTEKGRTGLFFYDRWGERIVLFLTQKGGWDYFSETQKEWNGIVFL